MLTEKTWHVIDVLMCVVGILSGLSGGLSFSTLFSNEPAMMWAYYSGCVAFACLVMELLRHHSLLHVCCTPFSLRVVSLYALLSLATTCILFLVHLSVGIRNRERVSGKDVLDHSDFIVAVWTFLTAKFCLKLYFVSKKSRQALLQQGSPRPESPDFQNLRYQGTYAESLDYHATGRRQRRSPGGRGRSSSETRRQRRRRSHDRADLLSDVSPMPTASQLAAASDSESAGDMDEIAQQLTLHL